MNELQDQLLPNLVNTLELPPSGKKSVKDWRTLEKKARPCNDCGQNRDCETEHGTCYWCWTTWFGPTYFEWKTCFQCGVEWSKLTEFGKCPQCAEVDVSVIESRARIESNLLKFFGSESALKKYTLENFMVLEGLGNAHNACLCFNPAIHNLYLWGKCGRGKTHLAYAVTITQERALKKVIRTTPMQIVDWFRKMEYQQKQDEFNRFSLCDVLLIDDLGSSKSTEFSLEIVSEILNLRSLKQKNGLIITSNLDLDNLSRKNHDDKISSRIAGLCRVIECESEFDYRLESLK